MKLLRTLFAVPVLLFLFTVSETPLTSCTKTTVQHDTVTVVKHDTTIVIDSIYDITSGLVAYYNFNGGSLKDSSGYGNNISLNNATVTTDRFGKAGNAYLFNGTSSYMRVPNSASLNPDNITLFAIVKINAFYTGTFFANQIMGKGFTDATTGLYFLRCTNFSYAATVDTTKEYFNGAYGDNIPNGTAAGAFSDTVSARTGKWYTLAYSYDGLVSKFYINGVLKGSRVYTDLFTDNANDLFIGRMESATYPYWFNGVIDDIRIYNRALPEGAITQLNSLIK